LIEKGVLPEIIPFTNQPTFFNRRLSLTLLWGLLENFRIREIVLMDTDLKILEIMQNHIYNPQYNKSVKHVLGCLHLLTCGASTGKYFFLDGSGWLQFFFECYKLKFPLSMLRKYFIVQCVANLLLFLERNEEEFRQYCSEKEEIKMLAMIEDYMNSYTPLEVQTKESKTTSWQSIKPFAGLLQSHNKTIFRLGAFTIAHLSYGIMNRNLMQAENLVSLVSCIQWSRFSDIANTYGQIIINNFKQYACPSLCHIATFHLRQDDAILHEEFTQTFELETLFPAKIGALK
jgi:hypothetical protein